MRVLGVHGMLSEVDTPALAMLCENLADYWGLRRESTRVERDASHEKDPDRQNDLLRLRLQVMSAVDRLDARVRAWLGDLLLTPYARSRAQAVRAPTEDVPLDLSMLDADERAALRKMLERRGEQRMLQ